MNESLLLAGKKRSPLSEDDKINPTKLNSYFSFIQGAKSANGVALNETNENQQQRGKRTVKL